MEIKKCMQCGGSLKHLRSRKEWVCPFCDARFEDEEKEKKKDPAEYYGLNAEVFTVERDLSKIMKKEGGAGCIRSIVYCMDHFDTAELLEEYMLKKLSFSDDISIKGVREEHILKAMPVIKEVMDPDERVIVYGNKGILTKGKEYFVITDKRSIFVNKKKVRSVLHTDIDSLKITDCGNCYINDDYEKGFYNLDGNGRFQGALIALICMFSLEGDADRENIRLI